MGLVMNPTEIAVSLGALLAVMLAVAVMLGRGLPEPVPPLMVDMQYVLDALPQLPLRMPEPVEMEPTLPLIDLSPGAIAWLPNGMRPGEKKTLAGWWAIETWRNWAPDPTLDRWADDGGR